MKKLNTILIILLFAISGFSQINTCGSVDSFMDNYAEETDEFFDFMNEFDYDREDDLWTDRKGGYEVEWEIDDDE